MGRHRRPRPSDPSALIRCNLCGQELPAAAFRVERVVPDGTGRAATKLRSICLACERLQARNRKKRGRPETPYTPSKQDAAAYTDAVTAKRRREYLDALAHPTSGLRGVPGSIDPETGRRFVLLW